MLISLQIIGVMMLLTMQALAELGVMYPVNGAFFDYARRFISESWGFATGWNYAINWLTVLPFEITAATITISFWSGGRAVNSAVWVTVFLVALCVVQLFGVRGYGEVEFVLSITKIIACTGFIILAIIIDCGGVPTDHRGYIGAKYWHNPGAFHNGFKGFCGVFTTASFSFAGTELVGLAAAEAANPLKTIPQAVRQVFWRITFFYIVLLFLVGLIVRSDNPNLLNATGANSQYSPFVIAIKLAGIKVLPSIFNVVITISVLSVANSCTFGSTRTMQALAARGMAPKALGYIDKHGRPYVSVIIQLAFGFLAYINAAPNVSTKFFDWLLALSGLADFFIWGSICFSHIRFRAGWKAQGRSIDEIPYKATFGVIGSWIGVFLNMICLMAAFYSALFPVGGSPNAESFFQQYLAAPLIFAFYLGWKLWTRDWVWFIKARDMDVTSGLRANMAELKAIADEEKPSGGIASWPMRTIRGLV